MSDSSITIPLGKVILTEIEVGPLADWVEAHLFRPENRRIKMRFKSIYRYEWRFYSLVIRKILLRQESYYIKRVRESRGQKFIQKTMFFGDLYCMNLAARMLLEHGEIKTIFDAVCGGESGPCPSNIEHIARQITLDRKKMLDVYLKDTYSVLGLFAPDPIQFNRPEVLTASKNYVRSRLRCYVEMLDAPGEETSYGGIVAASVDEEAFNKMQAERIEYVEAMFDVFKKNISKSAALKEGGRIEAELTLSRDITVKILKKRKYSQIISKTS